MTMVLEHAGWRMELDESRDGVVLAAELRLPAPSTLRLRVGGVQVLDSADVRVLRLPPQEPDLLEVDARAIGDVQLVADALASLRQLLQTGLVARRR